MSLAKYYVCILLCDVYVLRLVAMQLEYDDCMMLLVVEFKNTYGYAAGKTTYLCNMRSMHNPEGLIKD